MKTMLYDFKTQDLTKFPLNHFGLAPFVLRRDDKNGDQISGWKRRRERERERERVNVSPGRKERGEYIGEMKRISMHAMLHARPLTYTRMSTAADDLLSLG